MEFELNRFKKSASTRSSGQVDRVSTTEAIDPGLILVRVKLKSKDHKNW